mmetsp:Transcript_4092/g.6155  ORF Transcript_4092/g.6155 Transcript_4092/m.6155 type:complete len:91 (-) Transcript_4092:412-684(-)
MYQPVSTTPSSTSVPVQPQAQAARPPPPPMMTPTPVPSDTCTLPSYMQILPEDGCLSHITGQDVGTQDFLFDLTEEDWAIGEGLDMDTSC